MKPYDSSQSKKRQVEQMFDNIAPAYDKLNHLLSMGLDRLWRWRVVRMVAERKPARIVDVATGTADLAIDLAHGTDAEITGVDLSAGMVEIGRRKVDALGLSDRIRLRVEDAENMTEPDCSADCTTIAFGIRNFQNMDAGLKQMYRVLRSGGCCFVLEFSSPRGVLFAPVFRFYFHKILPFVGGAISGDRKAYSYLPASVDEFPSKERFEAVMRDAGFVSVVSRSLMWGVAYIYTGIKE